MVSYQNSRTFLMDTLEKIEISVINTSVRMRQLWLLKKRYLNKNDTITNEYKDEIRTYWRPFSIKINPIWHKYYSSRNGIYDVRYIPDDLYYTKIDQFFNNRKFGWGVNDKNYYSLWFSEVKQPVTIVRKINGIFYDRNYNILNSNDIMEICHDQGQIVIKPSINTGGGRGIIFWNVSDGNNILDESLFHGKNNLIVQGLIKQHEILNSIHSSSINTIRTVSFLFKERIHILSSVLRMGIDGARVDNASAGGITCGIKENGQLKPVAYSAHGVQYKNHPQGADFYKIIIPSYSDTLSIIKRLHVKMGHFQLISWDFAISENNHPILIEANLRNGEIDFHQFNNGPFFGDLTDEVLKDVFGLRR